jgi:hypothetical protein
MDCKASIPYDIGLQKRISDVRNKYILSVTLEFIIILEMTYQALNYFSGLSLVI